MAHQLCVQNIGSRSALGSVFVNQFAASQIVGLADALGQAAIHKQVGLEPELLAPFAVLALIPEDLLQAAG